MSRNKTARDNITTKLLKILIITVTRHLHLSSLRPALSINTTVPLLDEAEARLRDNGYLIYLDG
jgi:hypothetical protein